MNRRGLKRSSTWEPDYEALSTRVLKELRQHAYDEMAFSQTAGLESDLFHWTDKYHRINDELYARPFGS
jgi:hypothetical protein